MPSSIVEDNGVGGMLEDDNHGGLEGETETGLDKPDIGASRETRPTCIRGVIGGLIELCRMNGINEIQTARLIGRVAMDLCDKIVE